MTKPSKKKLHLGTETLRRLDSSALSLAAGGVTKSGGNTQTCESQCNQISCDSCTCACYTTGGLK
jgi:hypothetical protein